MNLHHPFRRAQTEVEPLSEEEWAPIAAALRSMPTPPARRDFRITPAQALALRPRPWHTRIMAPASIASGALALVLAVLLAPPLLSGMADSGSMTLEVGRDAARGIPDNETAAPSAPSAPGIMASPTDLACPSPSVAQDASSSPSPSPTPDSGAPPDNTVAPDCASATP